MTKNILHIIILLFLPIIIYGQEKNPELNSEMAEINLYVKQFDTLSQSLYKGRAEGIIENNGLLKRNGGWTANYLHEGNQNQPLKIIYTEGNNKTDKTLIFYYKNKELIYADLTVEQEYRNKKKNKTIEKQFYFKNGELINVTGSKTTEYGIEYLLPTEKSIRQLISG